MATILSFSGNTKRAASASPSGAAAIVAWNSLSDVEQQMVALMRHSPCPGDLIDVVAYELRKQAADDVWMDIERLAKGPRRTFWAPVQGGHADHKGRVFSTLDEVIDEATGELGELELGQPDVFTVAGIACCISRGRYRVRIHGLPNWMKREWQGLERDPETGELKRTIAEGGV